MVALTFKSVSTTRSSSYNACGTQGASSHMGSATIQPQAPRIHASQFAIGESLLLGEHWTALSAASDSQTCRSQSRPNIADVNLERSKYFEIDPLRVGAATEFQYLSGATLQFQGQTEEAAKSTAWLRLLNQGIGHRRLVLTSYGSLGLVPAANRVSDQSCVMNGLNNPLIIRIA